MIRPEQWEEVRAACEVLHDLASVQLENGNHPDAAVVVQWLDHVGRVAAARAAEGAPLAGKVAAAECGADTEAPAVGYLQ